MPALFLQHTRVGLTGLDLQSHATDGLRLWLRIWKLQRIVPRRR